MGRRPDGDGGSGGRVYRFDDVVVDAAAQTLTCAGELRPLEPKAFAVLLALLRRPHELVPRDALIDLVWGHQHVTPGVLTRVIAQLRHALDDDPHAPRYIRTRHALGYCFIGDLLPAAGGDPARERAPDAEDPDAAAAGRAAANASGEEAAGVAATATMVPAADPAAIAGAPGPPAGSVLPGMPPQVVALVAPATQWRWRPWLLAAAGLGLAVLATLALQEQTPRPATPTAASASIAVLPFTSLSADRRDAYFAEGLAVEMHDALAGVRGLRVAARSGPATGRDVDIRSLGRTLGVATVLDASVRREGNRVRVNARLSDTASGFTLWSDTYDREVSDVFAVQTQVASEVVRALLGVLPREPALLEARLAPTRNVAAYEAYLKGLQALLGGTTPAGAERAIGFFGQALAADAGFARAQAGICRAQIRRLEEVRDGQAFSRAREACERAARMDPKLHEVSLAFGELHRVQGNQAAAIDAYNRALADPALRADAWVGLARVEASRGANALAREYYQRALALRPGDAAVYSGLGYHHYLEGDLRAAIDAYRTAATLQPDDADLWASLGGLHLAAGDRDGAGEAFQRSLAISPNYAALSNLGSLRFETADYATAATLFRRAADAMPEDYRPWGNLGDALLADPATAGQAREAFARAATLARRYVEVERTDAQARAQLGWYSANLGQPSAARRWIGEADAMGTERGEVALWSAQAMVVLGDEADALARLQRARQAGIPEQRITAVPTLRRLLARKAAGRMPGTVPVNTKHGA